MMKKSKCVGIVWKRLVKAVFIFYHALDNQFLELNKNEKCIVSTLAEKVLDQKIKGENLDVLGLVVSSSLE